jgi:folate-binding protein YgfZ
MSTNPDLLASGKAFADLGSWRKIAVSGSEASDWLNDIISADIANLAPGQAKHSLMLSRTGGVIASFTVAAAEGGFLLLQDPTEASLADLLDRYVLSSNVELHDRSEDLSVFALPGLEDQVAAPGALSSSPSCLGAVGMDLICPRQIHGRVAEILSRTLANADDDDMETWRILQGIPRLGVDVLDGDLPQEAGLAASVSMTKGCYLGQEAVAKLEMLGRPRRMVVGFMASGVVRAGEKLLDGEADAGVVTSAVARNGDTVGLARVTRDAPNVLTTIEGVALSFSRPSRAAGT